MKLILLVDDAKKKLIFAQASKDFVDFLASLFPLPLGQVLNLLPPSDGTTIGNGYLKNFHTSISQVSPDFFKPTQETFVSPCAFTAFVPPLLDIDPSCLVKPTATNYFRCEKCPENESWISKVANVPCKRNGCTARMTIRVSYHELSDPTANAEGFVKGGMEYLVSDDLVISHPTYIQAHELVVKGSEPESWGSLRTVTVSFDKAKAGELLKYLIADEKEVLTKIFRQEINLPQATQP